MDEIKMTADAAGRWVMMCPCGTSEIRADDGPAWLDFELEQLGPNRYRITCSACGHVTEHVMSLGAATSKAAATT